ALHNPLVLGMSLAHLDFDHDGLLHLGRDHVAHLLIEPRCRRLLLCCRRHLPAPFFPLPAALLWVAFFAVVFATGDFAAFLTLFFALFLALFFSSGTGSVETSSCCAPRTPSSRSRATVLICAISLRIWRSFF